MGAKFKEYQDWKVEKTLKKNLELEVMYPVVIVS